MTTTDVAMITKRLAKTTVVVTTRLADDAWKRRVNYGVRRPVSRGWSFSLSLSLSPCA